MNNAEFLNNNFGTDYKDWMKCTWSYSSILKVWMVYLDGQKRYGWVNHISGDQVIEFFVDPLEKQIPPHRYFAETYRLVVDKAQGYKILGVYQYDVKNSRLRTKRVWVKVANSLKEYEAQREKRKFMI